MKFLMIGLECNLGGVASAFRNLSNALVSAGHEVDILDLPKMSILPDYFDSRLNLIPIRGVVRYWDLNMDAVQRKKGIKKYFFLLLGAFKKITNRSNVWNRIVFSGLHLRKHYDFAIGFRQSPVNYWLAKNKGNADLAVGFWHTDADFENIDALMDCLHYPDKICCVSEAITRQMKHKFPEMCQKFTTVYNLFDVDEIRRKSETQKPEYNHNSFNIITVGRLSPPKKNNNDSGNLCLFKAKKSYISVVCRRRR